MPQAKTKLLSISEAAREFPSSPNPSTVWRWIGRGVRGVKLEATRVGGKVFVTSAAIEKFSRAINGSRVAPNTERQAQIDQTNSELDSIGI